MSAIEQPAARSGSTTCWWSAVRMSADSAMKWTPQNTMNSASGRAGRVAGELEGVAGDVGELDDLVALVVVSQHEDPVAQRLLGAVARATRSGSDGLGQVARALHAPLGLQVPAAAERQQGQVDGGHVPSLVGARRDADPGGSQQRRVRDVRRRLLHPAQREEAAAIDARAGRPSRRRPPSRWRPRRGRSRPARPGRRPPAPPTSAAVAALRLLAASRIGTPDGVDVGVARSGGPVGHEQPQLAADDVVVGAVGGAPGPAVEGVEQVAVAGRAVADVPHHRQQRTGRPGRGAAAAGGAGTRPARSGAAPAGRPTR